MTTAQAKEETLAISGRLALLAADAGTEDVSLAWILNQLHERAFGLFLLILALPCCIPFLYGVPQVIALPLMFVAVQMLLGLRVPWLPERLGARTIAAQSLETLSSRAGPWLRRIELFTRPRLVALTRTPLDRVVGAALVLFSASILVPLPLTNTVPGFAIVLVAMALLQRDGVLVLLGVALGTAWIASLIFAGASLVSVIRTWLGV
ncbi:MAG: exopolysaccharide biosynthesis protein [Pseudomonadota bacterium]